MTARLRRSIKAGGAPAVAIVVVVVLVTLSGPLLGGKIFGSGDNILSWPPFTAQRPPHFSASNRILTDPVLGFNPDLLEIRTDLREGTVPLWNPYAQAGRPLLGSELPAPLFPTTWLALILPFWRSLALIAAAKLLLSAAGAYLFCRALGLRRGPSTLAAIVYPFGAYYFGWLEHPLTNAWAILPWMLFATRRVITRGTLGATALLGAATGLSLLGGHPESAGWALLGTIAYGAFELIAERTRGPSAGRAAAARAGPSWTQTLPGRSGLFVAALVLGLGVSAIVNVPFAELLGQSGKTQRGGAGYQFRFLWPFFFPEQWGSPAKAYLLKGYNYNEHTGYIGALPLLLGLSAIGRRRPREQLFFFAIVIVVLVTIFNTPIWANAVRDLPEGKLAAIGRTMILVGLAGAVLAAYGLQQWLDGTAQNRRRMLIVMSALAAIPVIAWVASHPRGLSHLGSALGQLPAVHPSERSPQVIAWASVWRWVLLCALGIGGLALLRRRTTPAIALALVLGLTAFDLVVLDRSYHGSIPLAQADPRVPPAVRYLQAHQGDARVTASGITLPPMLSVRYALRDPRVAIDLPFPSRYIRLWTTLGGGGGDEDRFFASAPRAHHLADIFATRYVLMPPGAPIPGWLQPVLVTRGGTVTFNRTALPRAWVAYTWQQAYAESNSLAETIISSTPQLYVRPVIEGSPAPPPGRPPAPTTAEVVAEGPQHVTIQAVAVRPGYLILDDSAYPGWKASVDGRAVAWHPANTNFRAIPIPAGQHRVTFQYRPASVFGGAIVTALCCGALLALALAGRRWSR